MAVEFIYVMNAILAFMMFGIALSLSVDDFRRVATMPRAIGVGLAAQFIALPMLSYIVTVVFELSPAMALGVILVGCCPGGNFSNLMTFIARGNTALSVSMTAVSSMLAVVALPLNFSFYASLNRGTAELLTSIEVGAGSIIGYVVLVLLIPLLAGLSVRRLKPQLAERSVVFFRRLSLILLSTFVVVALAANWDRFIELFSVSVLVVILHNLLALSTGFFLSTLVKLNARDQRAVTLETGIQNSGLGLGLILTFYSSYAEMLIIVAAWSIWHLMSGISLSVFWSRRAPREGQS